MSDKQKKISRSELRADDLDRIAALIERYAGEYRRIADEMRSEEIETIPVTGIASLEDRALPLIRGHANKLKSTVQTFADAKVLASLAETKGNYVVADTPLPKKSARKARKKDGEQ